MEGDNFIIDSICVEGDGCNWNWKVRAESDLSCRGLLLTLVIMGSSERSTVRLRVLIKYKYGLGCNDLGVRETSIIM